ncbi:hypothetical protein FXO38_30736 [Capsicum annuum]|nr:hypothetical protein FXO38_30736 [Capsicum annuum]
MDGAAAIVVGMKKGLLQLKANIKYSTSDDDDYLSSWGANETSDCCRWEGIVCSNNTRRVIELSISAKEEQLSNGIYTGNILRNWLFNASLFVPFKYLKALLLPGHFLAGWVKNEGFEKLRRLRKLEVLDLSGNRFNHSIFEPISQLSSLKSLNLSFHRIRFRRMRFWLRNSIDQGEGVRHLSIPWFDHGRLLENTGREGIDYQEAFSLIVKMKTVRTVLAAAARKHWCVQQMDVYNIFLNGDLYDEVYMDCNAPSFS